MIINGIQNGIISGSASTPTPKPPDIPGDIAGQVLWLRADQVVSPVNGQPFSTWNDLSPIATTYIQATSANQFTYNASDSKFGGKPSVSGHSTANMQTTTAKNAPLSLPMTIYVCYYSTDNTATQIFLSDNIDSAEFGITSNSLYTYDGVFAQYNPAPAINTPHALCSIWNAGSSAMYVDDSSTPLTLTTGSLPTSGFRNEFWLGYLGNVDGLLGNLVEIIVYTGSHTLSQREAVFGYLASRYSLVGVS